MSKASQIRQKAQEFLSKGQVDKAIQEYRRLISLESKNPNLYNELGDICLRAGDKGQAVANFEKASVIYEKVALYNNAVAVCKKILRVNPEKIDTVFKLAELRAKQKLEGEAVSFFSQYVEYVIANPQGFMNSSQKDAGRLIELMPANVPVLEKAVELFEQFGSRPKAAALCAQLAALAAQKGDARKEAHYRRKGEELRASCTESELAELREVSPQGEADTTSAAPDAEGPGAELSSAPEPAADASDAARETESRPSEASDLPSEAEDPSAAPAAAGDPERSEEAAGEADSRIDESTVDPGERARVSAQDAFTAEIPHGGLDARTREAVEEAEMVAAMSRGSDVFAGGRSPGGGAARLREAAPSRPARSAAQPSATEASSGAKSPGEATGAPEEKRDSLDGFDGHLSLAEEITSDVEKDDLKSHYDLGMAYLEMGLYTEAIKDFQVASRCEELQLSSMEMIGYCFLKNNQPRLAVKQLMRALEIAGVSGDGKLGIHYNLGLAHEMLGEFDSAREHFEEVYIVDMSFRDVSEKMKRLSTIS